jgi:hypothetical protein
MLGFQMSLNTCIIPILQAFIDYSDLVSRRMGFTPIPLAVLLLRICTKSFKVSGYTGTGILILLYLWYVPSWILFEGSLFGYICDILELCRLFCDIHWYSSTHLSLSVRHELFCFNLSIISPLPVKPKWTISLPSVCLSGRPSVFHSAFSFPDFSLQWMKIFNQNLIYDYISMSNRPSLSFDTLDQLLTELFPFMFTFCFPGFFFALDEVRNLKFFIWLPLE